MVRRSVEIRNKYGIHARAAAIFVKTAERFKSEIRVEKDGEEVNGKSILSVLMLAAGPGSVITIKAEGPDEEEAVEALERLVLEGFGEEE